MRYNQAISLPALILSLGMSLNSITSSAADSDSPQQRKDRLVVESLLRLKDVNINAHPEWKESIKRHLSTISDDAVRLKIIRQLNVQGAVSELIAIAARSGQSTRSVQALDTALQQGASSELLPMLTAAEAKSEAFSIAKSLGLSDRGETVDLLGKVLRSETSPSQIKIDAALGLARTGSGQKLLIETAKSGKLPGEAKALVGATLRDAKDESVRNAARELFPPMKTSGAPLAPVTELVKRKGDTGKGKELFNTVATCNQCHQVGSEGKNVGPALTEIGNKLSREAMYVSILDPSAGISHNFETYTALLVDDTVVTGLMVSQTDSNVTLKDAKGIERSLDRKDIEELKKQEKSLMPDNLQETMNEQGLVDLVEYLISLKK